MKLESTRTIPADPETVWNHLVDVDVLKQSIPGCQSMEETGENEYALTMKSKVGPVSATFKGALSLRDIVPGESYTLHFEGQGGAAGFAKGSADVRLEPADAGTNLIYSVDAKIGGKIAQLGQRLVDGAARKTADDFFTQFEQVVAPDAAESESEQGGQAGTGEEPAAQGATGGNTWLWIGAGIVVLIIVVWALI